MVGPPVLVTLAVGPVAQFDKAKKKKIKLAKDTTVLPFIFFTSFLSRF
jgi:hypothetical protein